MTDFTYHLLEEMETTEKEEGQQALAGLTSVHFRGILIDIFSGIPLVLCSAKVSACSFFENPFLCA